MSDTTAAARPPSRATDRAIELAIERRIGGVAPDDAFAAVHSLDLAQAWEVARGARLKGSDSPKHVAGLPDAARPARVEFIERQAELCRLLREVAERDLPKALQHALLPPLSACDLQPASVIASFQRAWNALYALAPCRSASGPHSFFDEGPRAPCAVRPDPAALAASIGQALAAGLSIYPAPGGQCEGFEGDDMVRSAWSPDPDHGDRGRAISAADWIGQHPGCNALLILMKDQGVLCFESAEVEQEFRASRDLLGVESILSGPVVEAPGGQVFAMVGHMGGANRSLASGVQLLTGPALMPLPGSVDARGATFAWRPGCELSVPAPAVPPDLLKRGQEVGPTRDQASTSDAQGLLDFYTETLREMLTEARCLADRRGDRSSEDIWREFRPQLVAWVADATGTRKGALSDDVRFKLSVEGSLVEALNPSLGPNSQAKPDDALRDARAAIDAAFRDLALAVLRETPPSATGTPIRAIEPGAAGSAAPLDHVMPGVTIRRFVTITAALRGLNKTSEAVVRAVSVATGLSLLGEAYAPAVRGRVVIFAGEDGADDWRRHVEAAIAHYRLDRSEVWANLKIITQPRLLTAGGRVLPAEVARIVDYLRANEAVGAIFDPLKSFHDANENDPGAADHVMKRAFSPIAQRANCAVELIHHFTKSAGDDAGIEATRGAGAFVDAARVGRVITPMSDQDASRFGLDDDEAADIRRVRLARYSFGPSGATTWLKVAPVLLASGAWAHTVEQWTPPAPFPSWTLEDVAAVQEIIALGGPGGRGFRHSHQADGSAGEIVADVMGLDISRKADRIRATRLLDQWIRDGWLKKVDLPRDDGKRKVPFVQVGRSAVDQPLDA